MSRISPEVLASWRCDAEHGYDRFSPTDVLYLFEEMDYLKGVIREIVSQIDQGGDSGKVFARDNCIAEARKVLSG